MKNKSLIVLKNIFMYATLIWSSIMLIMYLSIIFELPVFALISFIPFVGEFICDALVALLLLGIWGVPILYIITIPYILLVEKTEWLKKCVVKAVVLMLLLFSFDKMRGGLPILYTVFYPFHRIKQAVIKNDGRLP